MIGRTIGPYEVLDRLGAGGMGEVFRARDARLLRDVALKVLPPASVSDPDRRARFAREAQILAALNHANIAQVYGVEESDGQPVLVMELVEGPTLADALVHGALGVPETLAIAMQLCEGLDAAHERGIVHRDLKPANVKVRPDGSVKILDFGLARALTSDAGIDPSQSPTVLGARTEAGMVLGTAAYMSPEQARGLNVDKRADIWAFGCVVYEMLTGRPAFAGETTTDILAAVIQRDPDWSALPATLPGRIGDLLRRCLEKSVKDRQRDIADAKLEIVRAGMANTSRQGPSAAATPSLGTRGRRWTATATAAAGGAIAAGLLTGAYMRQSVPIESVRPTRVTVALPAATTLALGRGSAVAISPDGEQLVFAGRDKGVARLYLRALDTFESTILPGTEGASNPFFAPDGRWVGFFADQKLKKVALDGGAPVTVADAPNPRGEAWGTTHAILFSPTNNAGVSRVPAGGGAVEPLTTTGPGELSHRWPRFLPDGNTFLFTSWNDTGWEPSRIVAQRLDSGARTTVVEAGGGYGRYVRDGDGKGYLVYARSEGLLAAPFDEATLSLTGQAVPVVDNLVTNLSGGAHFDVSAAGTLAYVPGTNTETARQLAWVTLAGEATSPVTVQNIGRDFSLSPDGLRVLHHTTEGTTRGMLIQDLSTGAAARVPAPGYSSFPIWSQDGRWIYFARGVPVGNLYRRDALGTGTEEQLTGSASFQIATSLAPDGSTLAFTQFDAQTSSDVWVLPLPSTGAAPTKAEPRPFVRTPFSEGNAVFSPDGRWVAYDSNESGRFEVYAKPFPDGLRVTISTTGGLSPRWAPSGRELLFRALDGRMMAAPAPQPDQTRPAAARALFDASQYENSYAVAPDGSRLLMMRLIDAEQNATHIHLVLDFLQELRARVR